MTLADTAPRDDLLRAWKPGMELRAADADDADDGPELGTLHGHFTPFDRWTEIHSWFEGDFMERIAKGSFAKTISENRDQVKVLFNHGHDVIGQQVLGPIDTLREEDFGPYYEVPLLVTDYNRGLEPGLRAGLYGASFRFGVIQDEWNDEPGVSDHNPKGLPERTIREVRLAEFGPVTFPAYDDATAGVRSLADQQIERLVRDEDLALRIADHYDLGTSPSSGRSSAEGEPGADSGAASLSDEPPAGTPRTTNREAHLRLLTLTGEPSE